MLCSLCFKQKKDSFQLPCGHTVCLSCMPKRPASQTAFQYQCQTCLANHDIDMRQKMASGVSNLRQFSRVSSENSSCLPQSHCIFCWTCHEAIKLNDYIKGRHRQHSVQSYEQAIPSIKNLMLQQLQKSIALKEYLKENKEVLQTNNLKRNYQFLVDKVNDFFQKQIQLVQTKRQRLMQELNSLYDNNLKSVSKQIDILNPFIEEIETLEMKISQFLTDRIPITQISPISGLLTTLDQYSTSLKEVKFFVPDLPQFIAKSSIKDPIQIACQLYLKKPSIEKKLRKVSLSRPNIKAQFYGGKDHNELSNGNFLTRQTIQKGQQTDTVVNRKVRLVQKLKGKMKYSSSFCSTTLS